MLFGRITGTDLVHVPYKGAPQGVLAVMTGEVSMGFFNTPTVIHGEWLLGFAGDGSPLDATAVTEQRDAFLRTALDQLPTRAR